jgi:ABC-type Mn2+/Zn2+ transport system permease subunit
MSTLPNLLASLMEPFGYAFMQRALLSCALIGFTNGFLGTFIILRRQALLADALSHSLLPGLAVAAMLVGLSPAGLLLGGLVAALLVALGGQVVARNSRLKDETAVASLYIIAFAVGIVLIRFARVKVDLTHFLFGNILGVGDGDLWIAYTAAFLTLVTLSVFQRPLLLTLFDAAVARSLGIRTGLLETVLLALTVLGLVASLQAVGVLLSLGLLILPAATAYLLTDSFPRMLWGGAVLGMASAVGGLLLSFHANIASGPCIVMLLAVLLGAAFLFSPRYGILPGLWRGRHLHEESLERWAGHQGHDHQLTPERGAKKHGGKPEES